MTLSACSSCKNAADDVCLLCQSYIDIYQSVQEVADEQERNKVALYLAGCSFWEESELAKLVSCEVTLSQHAWSRIAYIKLQQVDQEMFAGLINVARSVVHNHGEQHHPVVTATPPPLAPGAQATIEALAIIGEPQSSPYPGKVAPSTPESTDQAEAGSAIAEPAVPDSASVETLTATHEAMDSRPDEGQLTPASNETDLVEQAMKELWTIAIAAQTQAPPAPTPNMQWGRGSGRATEGPDTTASSNSAQDIRLAFQRQSLPGIA